MKYSNIHPESTKWPANPLVKQEFSSRTLFNRRDTGNRGWELLEGEGEKFRVEI